MKILPVLLAAIFALSAPQSFAGSDVHAQHAEETSQNTIKMEIIEGAHSQGFPFTLKLTDIKTGKAITESDLKTVHTQKLHLLVIDPSLKEYYHIHPTANSDGSWSGYFTPVSTDKFRVWADVTRADTGKQEYVMADIHNPESEKVLIDKTVNLVSNVGEYNFVLTLDGELKAGEATMATITVNKNFRPFDQLEPVMGAFSHVVGFGEDYKSVMHIHPMGAEPEKETDRGGPSIQLHIEPKHSGFVKMFAQFRIDGKDIFAPFGVMVK